jgi:phage-related protein
MAKIEKDVLWMGSSRKDIREFPEEVREVFGVAIYFAQLGGKHPQATPMKGHKGAGVLEVIEDYNKDTYRCMYTVRYGNKNTFSMPFRKKLKRGSQHQRPILRL